VVQLGVQFGALYWAASQGVNVGLIALVIGTMPIVTALLGRLLFQEPILGRQWVGFAMGFSGVALAVGESVTAAGRGGGVAAYLAVLAGLLAISFGTLYQKRHASSVDPRSGLALQQLAAATVLLPFAAHEGFHVDGSSAFFASLSWVIGVNSVTAFALFFVLLKRGVVNQVATLFFLMPPVTALLDYLALGDALTRYQITGLALSALGVYLATRPGPTSQESSARASLSQDFGTSSKAARLRDGREVVIRPVGPADRDALKRFFTTLSPSSSRLRFHASMKEVPERLLREFTQPDQRGHVGFIAEARARSHAESPLLVAEARFIRCAGSDAAEFALVVADGWRRVGLGTSLMRVLLQQAGASGVRRLCGDALPDNETIRRFLRSLGGSPSGRGGRDDIVRVCLDTAERQRGDVISASR
jgi:drug/metabolite transporter (DMT)-like permease/GNAT superfamily N-acetyltransferase